MRSPDMFGALFVCSDEGDGDPDLSGGHIPAHPKSMALTGLGPKSKQMLINLRGGRDAFGVKYTPAFGRHMCV